MTDHRPSEHVRLYAGSRSDGRDAFEIVPARRLDDGCYLVLGTPGLAKGCAAGDTIGLGDDGRFDVVNRGGNVAVHIYAARVLDPEELDELEEAFHQLGGLVEAPPERRFAVVTVPVSCGFEAIEGALATWTADRTDVEWYFGNVYGDDDQPLGWWENR